MRRYSINENFDIYVDYKANLLERRVRRLNKPLARTPTTSFGVAMQYHF